MAIKQRRVVTPKEAAVADRVKRAKKSYPRFDRHGGYLEACAALAEETGCDPHAAYTEFLDRAEARLYTGDVDVDEAEEFAMNDTRERFRAAN